MRGQLLRARVGVQRMQVCGVPASVSLGLPHAAVWRMGYLLAQNKVSIPTCMSGAGEAARAHLAFPGEAFAFGFSTGTGSLHDLAPSLALTSVALSRSFLGWKGIGGGGNACMQGGRLTVHLLYRSCPPDTGIMPVLSPSFALDSAALSHALIG